MDYRTLFISDLTSLVIYTIALCALALGNRKMRGVRWFAICLLAGAVKVVLQSIRGLPPVGLTNILGTLVANEFNDFSFLAMYLGYRWFILRRPMKPAYDVIAVLGVMAIYVPVFMLRSRWAFTVGMVPVFLCCGMAAYLLARYSSGHLRTAGRFTAAVFVVQIAVAGYRTVLITHPAGMHGMRAMMTDPRWLYSMMLLTVLDSCFVASFLWMYMVELQSTLRHQASTDNLTGILNRRALDIEAEREIARCRRNGIPLSLIVLDIDHFKHLNDARGHDAGDVALRSFAELLLNDLRGQDLVARSGGEEFIVLLPETALYRAQEVAERIRCAIEANSVLYDGLPICITASLGVAELWPDGKDTWEALRRRGDLAMYTAKRMGRNRVEAQMEDAPILLRELTGSIPATAWDESPVAVRQRRGAGLRPRSATPEASASQSQS